VIHSILLFKDVLFSYVFIVRQVVTKQRLNIVTHGGDKYQLLSISQKSILGTELKQKRGENDE